jgi:phosphonopyruvate decarboxylase
MISARHFVDELITQGTTFFSGVPCSFLTPLINEVAGRKETRHVLASSEGDAVSIASGIWLGGKTAVVLCQNSGLGNMVNPLTSLNEPFRIPVLLLVTWRGKPGTKDEPQHELMGRITPELLSLIGVEWMVLPDDEAASIMALRYALDYIHHERRPFALVVSGDTFAPGPQCAEVYSDARSPLREEVLATFLNAVDEDAVVVATTGKTGRELFTLADRPGHLYCVGSMGYASSIAHGIALSSARPVYLLDGDGAAIMHMGNLTSIGASSPANLTHIVLDNGSYDSTGAQPTASASVNFLAVGIGAGYAHAQSCRSCNELSTALRNRIQTGPRLLHVPIRAGSMARLGRPTEAPHNVAHRLRSLLTDTVPSDAPQSAHY